MTRSELLRRISTAEFIKWIAYFTLEEQDRERAAEDAEDQARAKEMARSLAGWR